MDSRRCNWYWGSHGCSLTGGHESPHVCRSDVDDQPCSEHDGSRVRYHFEEGDWSEWYFSEGFTA